MNRLVLTLVILAVWGCSNPSSPTTASPAAPTVTISAGNVIRQNKSGDQYSYAITGYLTPANKTNTVGTVSGTGQIFFSTDTTYSPPLVKETAVLNYTYSDGETYSNSGSMWYNSAGADVIDTIGQVSSISGDRFPVAPTIGASWTRTISYTNGTTNSDTYLIKGNPTITVPYGIITGTWQVEDVSSNGSVSYIWEAPALGCYVQKTFAQNTSSNAYTGYLTISLSSYTLAP